MPIRKHAVDSVAGQMLSIQSDQVTYVLDIARAMVNRKTQSEFNYRQVTATHQTENGA